MKLVDKLKIAEDKSKERAKEVQEGVKLAKSVDLLRETYASEQEKLRLFRDSTLKSIKSEIDILLPKKNALNQEITTLEQERIRLSAPVDLTEEWNKVKRDRKELNVFKDDIVNRETTLISRELQVEATTKDFFEREEKIKEDRILADRYVSEANTKFNESESIKSIAQKERDISNKQIRDEEERLRIKEVEILTKERDTENQRESNEQAKIEIEKEKLHIESQQQSLKVAWDNIRKLKQ